VMEPPLEKKRLAREALDKRTVDFAAIACGVRKGFTKIIQKKLRSEGMAASPSSYSCGIKIGLTDVKAGTLGYARVQCGSRQCPDCAASAAALQVAGAAWMPCTGLDKKVTGNPIATRDYFEYTIKPQGLQSWTQKWHAAGYGQKTGDIYVAYHQKDKVVVVTAYTPTLELISDALKHQNIKHVCLYGGTKDPLAARRQFMDDPKTKVFIMNAEAGGTGLDGLQKVARYMVLYESPCDPITRKQVLKRIHRPGQQQRTYFYDLVVKGSVDVKILSDVVNGVNFYSSVIDPTDLGKRLKSLFAKG